MMETEAANLPLVAIVILNYNGSAYLKKFLPSVLNTTYRNRKIIVADNASTDDSKKTCAELFPDIAWLQLHKNHGYAQGYNEALKQVTGDYYILLNNDVEVDPGWLEPIVFPMEADKAIAAAQPKLLMYGDKGRFEYAGACGGWIDALGYPFARGRVFDTLETDAGQYNTPQRCFWASGAALAIRPNLFHEIGGFDESFFAHQEEIDLCWRLQNKGYSIYCFPGSIVYHVGGGTLARSNPRKTFLNFRNNLIMLYKNLPTRQLIWKMPLRFLLDTVALLKFLRDSSADSLAVAKAHGAVLRFLFSKARRRNAQPRRSLRPENGFYEGSIVAAYFLGGKKTFKEIVGGK